MNAIVIKHLTNKFIVELLANCEVIQSANIPDDKKISAFKTLIKQLDALY